MYKNIERKILLNPGPSTTTDTVKMAQVVPDICPREKEFGSLLTGIREDLLKVVNAPSNDYTTVLIGGSGTAIMESVISSTVDYNKKLLILVNGAYGERMCEIVKAYQIPHLAMNIKWGQPLDFNKIKNTIKRENINFIAMVHHETTTGILNSIKEFSQLKNEFNCTLILDAISSYAGSLIDLENTPIDYLMSTSNKCLQGMAGIAFSICRKDAIMKIETIQPRNFYLDLFSQYLSLENNQQSRFTPPVQTAYALRIAIDELINEGFNERIKRYKNNWTKLRSGLEKLGFQLLLDSKYESQILLSILEPKNPHYDFNKLHDLLYSEGFTIYPGKVLDGNTFRLSVIGDLNSDDIENFLECLKKSMLFLGIELLSKENS